MIFWRILDVFSRGFCLENWPPAILRIFKTFFKCYHAVYHSTRNFMLVSKMSILSGFEVIRKRRPFLHVFAKTVKN